MAKNTEAMDRLKSVSQDLFKSLGDKAVSAAGERVTGLTDKFQGIADGGPVKQAVAKGGEAAAKGDSSIMVARRPPRPPTSSSRPMSGCPSTSPTTSGRSSARSPPS